MAERYMIARQFGAEVILTAPGLGIKGCLKAYNDLIAADPNQFFGANQFQNPANPEIHYKTTGPEVYSQTGGAVDIFIHGIGTGGTISGAGKYLKEMKPSCQIVAIEPSNARVHVGMAPAPHTIVGIGAGIPTHFLNMPTDAEGNPVALASATPIPGVVDEWAHASQEEAVEFARKACMTEGMMIGPSAGAALKVACDIATRPESQGKTIVVVLASHGIRYGAHPMWADVKAEAATALPKPPNMDKTIQVVQWDSSASRR
jgi:cysteine synthase A